MLLSASLLAQQTMQYNININNGLPSNHVYWVDVDKYGYLWISTDNGLVRYNGYQFHLYNTQDGLPNNDIWGAMEDKKGRMWLYTISNDFGYLYKGKYKKVFIKDAFPRMYPRQIQQDSGGIIFLNNSKSNESVFTLCKERNDTVFDYRTDTIIKITNKEFFDKKLIHRQFLSEKNELMEVTDKYLVKIDITNSTPRVIKLCRVPASYFSSKMPMLTYLFKTYLVACSEKIYALNYADSSVKTMPVGQQEHFITGRESKGKFYLYSNKATYVFNNKMDLVEKIDNEKLFKNKIGNSSNFVSLYDDDFWQRIIATTDNGLYIDYDQPQYFKTVSSYDLTGYRYVGITADSIHCWWNKPKQTMASVDMRGHATYHKYDVFYNLRKVVPYNNNTSLLLADNNTYWMDNVTKRIKPIFENSKHFIPVNDSIPNLLLFPNRDAFVIGGRIYFLSFNSLVYDLLLSHDTVLVKTIDRNRKTGIAYDYVRKSIWLYDNNSTITIYHEETNTSDNLKGVLESLGIKNIEKIWIDNKYGNIFLKDDHRLFLFNYPTNTYKELFPEYRLGNTVITLYGNMIIAAGSFGVLFSRINGLADISQPILYENVKNTVYNYVSGMQVLTGKVVLNTDNGLYSVQIPSYASNVEGTELKQRYTFLIKYDDSIRNIRSGDTINIDQKDRTLQFDVINPYGNGQLIYQYKIAGIDTNWQMLNSNELHLAQLNVGEYYFLSVYANDKVWNSKVITLHVLILPYWWQTPFAKKIIAVIVLALVLAAVLIIISVTKRIIIRKNQKKNFQQELELKAIHSQINPHFIFNTLGAALSFIDNKKLDAAYTHISKFSQLLRAYLKSSRNKLITLADEITNLRNYIDLQKTRFDNKFEYEIMVDDTIDTQKISIPSLLLQPIVENAIAHGLFHRDSGGLLKIEFRNDKTNNDLICIIEDNGVGREKAKKIQASNEFKRQSYGDQLVKDLVRIFNSYEKMNIEINYVDRVLPETGTVVTLIIKNPHHEQ